MRTASPRWFAAALIAISAFAFGCATTRPRAATPVAATTPPDAMPAAAMFKTLCSHCHGPDAKGYAADRAPSLVNPTFLESATDEFLRRSIATGRPGTSMAAYSKDAGGPLGPEAIDRLVAWIRAHGSQARALAPVPPGSSMNGAVLYGAQCQKCHGEPGTRGPDVMLTNPGFLNAASDAFIQHAISEGRPGTEMIAFKAKLGEQQIADIVAYLRSHAQPLDASRMPAPTGSEPLFLHPRGEAPTFVLREDRFVGVDQVAEALNQHRRLVIIDARPESEWMSSHIAGAVPIPHYQLERLSQIPKDAYAIAYCACPHHLSGIVVDSLRARGYPHAYVLDEGVLEWEKRGYPMVKASAPDSTRPER